MTTIWIDTSNEGSLSDIINWCQNQFGPNCGNLHEARRHNSWSYNWEGWSSEKRWVIHFSQPEWTTLFSLRWGSSVEFVDHC